MKLTQAGLMEFLHYDPKTGIWRWLKSKQPRYNGCIAGNRTGTAGYYKIEIDGKPYYSHHLAWLYMTGSWPILDVDHKDGDRGNCAWDNLRLATRSQNNANSKRRRQHLPKGVSIDKSNAINPYFARIKGRYLGCFPTAQEAHLAYCEAAKELYREFARFA